MSCWERGYGDFVMKPDFDTLRPIPWHEGTVLLMADLAVGGRHGGGRLAAADPAPPARAAGGARLAATAGTELEFIVFNDTYEEAWRKGYRDLDPANLYNVDYSMLGTARVEPLIRRIRNSMMGAGHARSRTRRASATSASTRSTSTTTTRSPPPTTTSSTRPAPRRSPPRRACRSPSWRSSTSARATRATSTARCSTDGGGNVFADDETTVPPLRRRPARLPARPDALLRAARELVQALRAGLVRPHRGGLGQGQPHLLDARGRPRPGRCASRTGCPGADVNPYLALAAMIAAGLHGIDNELELEPRVRGQRLRVRQAARAAHDVRGARSVRRLARSRARRSARRSWTTT